MTAKKVATNMSVNSEPNYYLVRADQGLVEKDIVGVGWVDCKFNEIETAQEAIEWIIKERGSVRRWANQIRRFYAITEGDIVIVPLPKSVAIGKAIGGLLYDPEYKEADRANQRKVEFFRDEQSEVRKIPRTNFSEAFQRRLRAQGSTIRDLQQFAEEIEKAVIKLEEGGAYLWSSQVEDEQSRKVDEFKEKLLKNIRSGQTQLKTGGRGLEELICELLIAEGYDDAQTLGTRGFKGTADADVMASRCDRYGGEVKLLIQAKHHHGFSSEEGIRQLEKISEQHSEKYDDYNLVFVTTANVSEELRKTAEKADVTVTDGEEFVDWITDNLSKLKPETKRQLGIYEVPGVV
ncbi:restriction endonuclease [bacterium]|nr:restriction endonuclease [bacterium]